MENIEGTRIQGLQSAYALSEEDRLNILIELILEAIVKEQPN